MLLVAARPQRAAYVGEVEDIRTLSVLRILTLGAVLASYPIAINTGKSRTDGFIDRAETPNTTCPVFDVLKFTEEVAVLPPGFIDCNANSIPDDCDIEWGTSLDCNFDVIPDECQVVGCELEDGVHLIEFPERDRIAWFPERGFNTFNLYRGDLELLKMLELYTQDPATIPLAARSCHLAAVSLADGIVPEVGQAVYYLLTGDTGSPEGSLGADSNGIVRRNDNPCPPPPALSVSVRTDKAVYAPGEVVLVEIDLANLTATEVITLHFPTTCQASFRVEDLSGAPVYNNPQNCFFIFTQLVLQPDQTATYTDAWPQIDDSGEPLTLSGELVIRGVVLDQVPEPSGITGISIRP
jgi:hypothetical protein